MLSFKDDLINQEPHKIDLLHKQIDAITDIVTKLLIYHQYLSRQIIRYIIYTYIAQSLLTMIKCSIRMLLKYFHPQLLTD